MRGWGDGVIESSIKRLIIKIAWRKEAKRFTEMNSGCWVYFVYCHWGRVPISNHNIPGKKRPYTHKRYKAFWYPKKISIHSFLLKIFSSVFPSSPLELFFLPS